MSDFHKNPLGDIYRIMDESGFSLTMLQNPGKPQKATINEVRVNLAENLRRYIRWRDDKMEAIRNQRDNEETKI